MADKPFPPSSPEYHPGSQSSSAAPSESSETGAPTGESRARSTGLRTSDAKDAMTEMAERAQLISQEAGTKIAAAMKDVISAAAGIAGFAVESARDLVQFMVRRGQMTQDEADKLIREAEQAHGKRGGRSSSKAAATAVAAAPSPERAQKSEPARDSAKREATKGAATAKSTKQQASKRDTAAKKPSSKRAPKKRH